MVRLGENQIAEVYFQNEWVPICGHWFWNNNIGATLFCQELGFQYGYIKNQSDLPNDGLRIGQCNAGDSWLQCSHDGCNQLEVGGFCNNGLGACTQGQHVAVSIGCFNEGTKNLLKFTPFKFTYLKKD